MSSLFSPARQDEVRGSYFKAALKEVVLRMCWRLSLTFNKEGVKKVRCRHGVWEHGFKDESFVVELLKRSTLLLLLLQEMIKGRTDE